MLTSFRSARAFRTRKAWAVVPSCRFRLGAARMSCCEGYGQREVCGEWSEVETRGTR